MKPNYIESLPLPHYTTVKTLHLQLVDEEKHIGINLPKNISPLNF